MSNLSLPLLVNATATGSAHRVEKSGRYIWSVDGTFGGDTAQLQALSPDGTSFIDVPGASLAAQGFFVVDVSGGTKVKCTLTGGGSSAMYSNLTYAGA